MSLRGSELSWPSQLSEQLYIVLGIINGALLCYLVAFLREETDRMIKESIVHKEASTLSALSFIADLLWSYVEEVPPHFFCHDGFIHELEDFASFKFEKTSCEIPPVALYGSAAKRRPRRKCFR